MFYKFIKILSLINKLFQTMSTVCSTSHKIGWQKNEFKHIFIPCSSVSKEHIFSIFDLVWNKLSNRLEHERASKLVKFYRF